MAVDATRFLFWDFVMYDECRAKGKVTQINPKPDGDGSQKGAHGRQVEAWARGGGCQRWPLSRTTTPCGGIRYYTIRAASHKKNESLAYN